MSRTLADALNDAVLDTEVEHAVGVLALAATIVSCVVIAFTDSAGACACAAIFAASALFCLVEPFTEWGRS